MNTSPIELKQEHLSDAKLYANRRLMIAEIGHEIGAQTIAEIGVAYGDFSHFIIESLKPDRFDAFDLFRIHKLPLMWGRPPSDTFGKKTHLEWYHNRFSREIAAGIVHTYEGGSSEMLSTRPDKFYDLIYIDGAHDLEGVRCDADAACKKIKDHGVLIFNDYIMFDHLANMHYGIVPVVNDLCANHGWRITHFAFHPEMFCDIALKKNV